LTRQNQGTQRWPGLRAAATAALLCAAAPTQAVITESCCYFGVRNVTLRVGTAAAAVIDVVRFDVGNAAIGNSLPFAANPHGSGVPVVAATGAVPIEVTMNVPGGNLPQPVSVTVTSPANLTCVAGGCGAAVIPFSSISWTASSPAAGDFINGSFPPGGGATVIQTDTFNGFVFGLIGGQYRVTSALTFSYANTVAYPAGRYQGRVTYTVSLP
jgi:hypothetical protein